MIERPKVNMACSHCGSVDVLCDAYAEWCVESQTWELSTVFDKGAYCTACDGDTRIRAVPLGIPATPSTDDLQEEPRSPHKLDFVNNRGE